MGKASSAKKVARAARAGGTRRSGQRRALGFPAAVVIVIVVGLVLVVFARSRRNADAFPRANLDHIHSTIDIYTCVTDKPTDALTSTTTTATTAPASSAAPGDSSTTTPASDSTSTTTPDSTTTTAPVSTSTTQLNTVDVHGEYQPAPTDATQDVLGIHTHGDGLIHIHPFADSAAGRKATLGLFLDQVGISMTNEKLTLYSGGVFTEGTTKCEGGKDGQLQVAKWDHVADAASGGKPNQIFTDGFDKIRLGASESFVIAFMPAGSTIKAKPDVQDRINNVSDLGATTTTAPLSAGSSGAPTDGSTGPSSTEPNASSATATTVGSASSSGP